MSRRTKEQAVQLQSGTDLLIDAIGHEPMRSAVARLIAALEEQESFSAVDPDETRTEAATRRAGIALRLFAAQQECLQLVLSAANESLRRGNRTVIDR